MHVLLKNLHKISRDTVPIEQNVCSIFWGKRMREKKRNGPMRKENREKANDASVNK
jgi:hypothetical protein